MDVLSVPVIDKADGAFGSSMPPRMGRILSSLNRLASSAVSFLRTALFKWPPLKLVLLINAFGFAAFFVLTVVGNQYTKSFLVSEVENRNLDAMSFVSRRLDKDVSELHFLLGSLTRNASLQYFNGADERDAAGDIINAIRLSRELTFVRDQGQPLIAQVMFLTRDYSVLVSPGMISFSPDYSRRTVDEKFLSSFDHAGIFASANGLWINDTRDSLLLSFAVESKSPGRILFLFDRAYPDAVLSEIPLPAQTRLIVTDTDRVVLFSSGGYFGLGETLPDSPVGASTGSVVLSDGAEDFVSTSSESGAFDLSYSLLFPRSLIDRKIAFMNRHFLLTVVAILFGVSASIVLLNGVLRKPLRRIFALLGHSWRRSENEFDVIRKSIAALQADVQTYRLDAEASILNRFLNTDDMSSLDMSSFDLDHSHLFLTVYLRDRDESSTRTVESILASAFPITCVSYAAHIQLYMVDVAGINNYRFSLEKCMREMSAAGVRLHCGCSDVVTGLEGLKRAKEQSIAVMKYWCIEERESVCHFHCDLNTYSICLPDNELAVDAQGLREIVDSVCNGKTDLIAGFVGDLVAKQISFIAFRNTCVYVIDSIVMAVSDHDVDLDGIELGERDAELLRDIANIYDVDSVATVTERFLVKAAEFFGDRVGNLDWRILEYIERNLQNELCMNSLVEHFGKSRSFLTKRIKKLTGKGFIKYVNTLKMERVRQLLSCTDKTIREIAEDLGYRKPQSLIDKFKALRYHPRCVSHLPEREPPPGIDEPGAGRPRDGAAGARGRSRSRAGCGIEPAAGRSSRYQAIGLASTRL